MTSPADPLRAMLAGFETAALAAGEAETRFKREIDRRIAELEQARAFAHRRLRLIAAMSAPIATEERAAALAARLDLAFVHIGWADREPDPTELEVHAALEPVAAAIEDLARPGHAGEEGGEPPPPAETVAQAFAGFEDWYRRRFGVEFLAVFEQRAAFRPVVDF